MPKYKSREYHGMTNTPEYMAWRNMHMRCFNPGTRMYYRYGARGITICARWMEFSAFIADVGRRPSDLHSIDRIDSNGNYEPGNVRWATKKEQQQNMSRNVYWTHNGETLCLREWSRRSGVGHKVLAGRIARGLPPEEILMPTVKRDPALKGVYFSKRIGRWQARKLIDRKPIHLGTFDTAEDALRAKKQFETMLTERSDT